MAPRVSFVTLGVASVAVSRAFYERLGWTASGASQEGVAFFQLGPVVLALFGRQDLADDAQVANTPAGFSGISLAQNFASPGEVDLAYEAALSAGATPLKPPGPVFWGGHTAYFADPDGFAWELAHNPFFPLDDTGAVILPP
ncbi:VOC family protein [Hyphomicrobiales bacterium BP6-180914]|uniref:VOC family protein n=1 Tax=Lichenifustis flavocetrariae TaxID=2949735 RepID=A0AA41YRU5_9HYPH|nr:VOC family protein [Lichenifustis flavocetrariae]MCW6507409.1 VOC family protein [Lichenifustis flavocetrariae]